MPVLQAADVVGIGALGSSASSGMLSSICVTSSGWVLYAPTGTSEVLKEIRAICALSKNYSLLKKKGLVKIFSFKLPVN